ncbi:MAG: hypothetical protein LBV55_03475 [Acholeplasmatales bacterium]|nr:hypothetical protein [Acholeplasmatales bacterium]
MISQFLENDSKTYYIATYKIFLNYFFTIFIIFSIANILSQTKVNITLIIIVQLSLVASLFFPIVKYDQAIFLSFFNNIFKIILTIFIIILNFGQFFNSHNINTSKIGHDILSLILIALISFPYIFFHRTSLVIYTSEDFGSINPLIKNFSISLFSNNHLIIDSLFLILLVILYFIRKILVNDRNLLVISLSLILLFIERKMTIISNNSFIFYILPDSPCSIGAFLILIYALTKSKLTYSFIIFINLPLVLFNVLFLYTGTSNNLFSYYSFDTIMYHIYLASTGFLLFTLIQQTSFQDLKNSLFLFLVFQLIFLLLGVMQEIIEKITNLDFMAESFYGFGYMSLPLIGSIFKTNIIYFNYVINVIVIFMAITIITTLFYFIKKKYDKNMQINITPYF